MRVYIIRHSVRESPEDFEDAEEGDPEAELTEEGEAIAHAVGQWMAEHDEIPTVILASPTVRGQQTAHMIAEAIEDAGYVAPEVQTDAMIGPHMSIRGTLLKVGADEAMEKVALVSHRGAIQEGLRQLDKDGTKPTPMSMGELRVVKVKRKTGRWEEKERVLPSDLGFGDTY